MIVYLVTKRHRYTIEKYLDGWAPWLRSFVQVTPYQQFLRANDLRPGTYIFSDLERLSGASKVAAEQAHTRLLGMGGTSTVLNDPGRSLMRYDLLCMLRELRINDFSAYRLTERRKPRRFPVFLREEDGHRILTPLLHCQLELDKAIARLFVRRRGLANLLMVEFSDTSDRFGEFRKYAAFIIGDTIIPKHAFFSRDWLVKQSDVVDSDRLREERQYLDTNPHESEVRRIFEMAKINYGRIDYAMSAGRIQVWEINTNPMILAPSDRVKTERLVFKEMTNRQVADAFESLNGARTLGTMSASHAPKVRASEPWSRPNVGVRLTRRTVRKSRAIGIRIADAVGMLFWRPLIARLEHTRWR